MKKPTVLIFLGPPGIGKGTQAAKVSQHLSLPHISTGDILRDHIKRKTPLGLQMQAIIEKGSFVPDHIVSEMIEKRTQEKDCERGYILDGYPRTLSQAEHLGNYLKDKAFIRVVNYSADPSVIVERLSGRLTCKNCGKSYHLTFSPSKKHPVCDVCSSELTQRKDDHPDVVSKRLEVYEKETQPLIDYYKSRDLLTTISCDKGIDEIFEETIHLIG